MKEITEYVSYDESRKSWCGRVSLTDPDTGKRKWFKRYASTKTEARERVREQITRFENEGLQTVAADRLSFAFLAQKFKKEKLIPAVYVGERKTPGRRNLSTPLALLNQLRLFFDGHKLTEITVGEVRKFKVWLAKIPRAARSKR